MPPEQIIEWGVFPQGVMDALLQAAGDRLRLMIIGGAGSGDVISGQAVAVFRKEGW